MGVRGKRQGDPGAVKGKGSPVVSPARVEDSMFLLLPSRASALARRGVGGGFGAHKHPHAVSRACAGAVRGL
jgi:hypothetical protein